MDAKKPQPSYRQFSDEKSPVNRKKLFHDQATMRRLIPTGSPMTAKQIALTLDWDYSRVHPVKRALMRAGYATEQKRGGSNFITLHEPALHPKDRKGPREVKRQKKQPSTLALVEPTPSQTTIWKERQAAADWASEQHFNKKIWTIIRDEPRLDVSGSYTAKELREFAEAAGKAKPKILITGGAYTAAELRGLKKQIAHMLRDE